MQYNAKLKRRKKTEVSLQFEVKENLVISHN